MRKICLLLCCVFLLLADTAFAEHIAGGSISYTYLGTTPDGKAGNYRITLRLYRECGSRGAKLDTSVAITIYPTGSSLEYANQKVSLRNIDSVFLSNPDPCVGNPPRICYGIGYYTFDITLPFIQKGYVVAFQRCCRIGGIFNVINSDFVGVTYVAYIPGTEKGLNAPINSTPEFKTSDTVIVCADNYFKYDFGAIDADGDQLEYVFDEAFSGLTYDDPVATIAQPPDYEPVRYNFGFSGSKPLGANVSIDAGTGLISGIAPVEGIYVVTVAVLEKRNGVVINRHRKDLHLKVADCLIARAVVKSEYINCDDQSILFQPISTNSLVNTYEWDFGVPGITTDVSNSPNPTFVYTNPGEYTVRLITNEGQPCDDTVYTKAKVFPGFKPGFKIEETCKDVPYSFIDTSNTPFGTVNSWKWDFGDPTVLNDTSTDQTATYTYASSQSYDVSLIISTNIGCIDTVTTKLNVVDKPVLNIMNDTLICSIDTLQLKTTGTGKYSWTPNYMINDRQSSNPLVSPDVPTKYYVTLTQAPGCINNDSVFVDVKSFVSLKAGTDTTICLGDSIYLDPITDGQTFLWSPSGTINDNTKRNSWAKPTENTRYSLFSTIGKCQATDGFVINVAAYPDASVSIDTSICFGEEAQLDAFGGVKYFWYPGNTLDDQTRKNPIAKPYQTTSYRVAVYGDGACPKPAYDTVVVRVIPPVSAFAGNDTVAVIGQPLQLFATGGYQYSWEPSVFLDNSSIQDPVAKLNDDITYRVKVSTIEGCFAYDEVKVRIYKTPPEIFVPTAFTPNGDGLNDQLKPIPVGISSLVYFKVYNRYGELVFNTTEIGKGWNGVYKGRDQGNESFVWQAQGIDYLGNAVLRKGQATLIR